MKKPFAEQLDDLVDLFLEEEHASIDDLISALRLKLNDLVEESNNQLK